MTLTTPSPDDVLGLTPHPCAELHEALLACQANPTPPAGPRPRGIEGAIVEPGSGDWMSTISASKVAAIVGLSPYASRYTTWHQLAGLEPPEADKPIFQRGHLLEPAIANWFASQHPEAKVATTSTWTHAERPHQTASPDRLVLWPTATPGVEVVDLLEIKSTTKGYEWGEPGTNQVPPYYWVQSIWQMDTTGWDRCHFAIISEYLEFSEYVVDYDPVAAALLREAVDEFWAQLQARTPPPIDPHPSTLATVRSLNPGHDGAAVEIPADHAVRYIEARNLATRAAEAETYAKAAIAEMMGEAKAATCNGTTIVTRRPAKAGATPSLYPGRRLDGFAAPEAPTPEPVPQEVADEIVAAASAEAEAELSAYVYDCLRSLGKAHPELRPTISRRWPTDVPPKPPWTETQARAIEDVLAPLHAAAGDDVPFPPTSTLPPKPGPEIVAAPVERPAPQSWHVDDDGTMPAAGEIEALAAQVAKLDPQQKAQAGTWARDGKTGGRPWNFGTADTHLRTARIVAISAAVLACLTCLWDPADPASVDTMTRLALRLAIDEELQPGWRTGAVLGALTLAQAQRLAHIAEAFAASREPETSQLARLAAALPAA